MKRYMLWATTALIVLFMEGCDLMDTHPYSVHVTGDRNLNARNIRFIEEACQNKDTIRFVLTGDTQAWFDETYDMVNCINEMGDIDFVLHGGDLSDFGMTEEILWQRDLLRKLKCPFVVILGNHDCLLCRYYIIYQPRHCNMSDSDAWRAGASQKPRYR